MSNDVEVLRRAVETLRGHTLDHVGGLETRVSDLEKDRGEMIARLAEMLDFLAERVAHLEALRAALGEDK